MKITYNLTGEKRKSLVGAISQELNVPAKYLGAPTFAYEVGSYRIDRDGTLTGEDNRGLVADLQGLHGFIPTGAEYDALILMPEAAPAFENLELTETEELGLGKSHRETVSGENGMQASDVPESDETNWLVVEIPLTGFTPEKLDNLTKLVNAKASLLKAALGSDDLPIQQVEDRLRFPWFQGKLTSEAVLAYTTLVSKLCEAAREKKRVTAKECLTDNPKYSMRCWLLSLGFIGDEYKAARKILLSKLDGDSAFRNGHPAAGKADE
ncbi:MAG: virulence protein [Eubacteriales bacterium]|nr:virulence protein [Eubacteriales bacterium]